MRRAAHSSLGVLLLLAACRSPVAETGRTPKPGPSVAIAATPAASPASHLASPVPTPTPALLASQAPAVPGATLSGHVKAPAPLLSENGLGVISNHGSGVVSNNGGNIVSDHGGGYRLLTAETVQVPVPRAVVSLLDAAGHPLLDAAGKALTTTTAADGTYAFNAPLPAHGVLVQVELPGGHGQLASVVPRAQATADLDLISTLSTGYVVRLYVQSQQDPQSSLDKLSVAVEAETRARTASAFAGGTVAVPDSLTSEHVIAAVQSLRRQDSALSAKLEEVKCLLVAAGQCDLGEGQLGTDARIDLTAGMIIGPDGHLYVNNDFDDRVWRLDADGRVRSLAKGVGNDVLDTNPTLLRNARAIAFDPGGQAVIQDYGVLTAQGADERISLLGLDGRVNTLWHARRGPKAVLADAGGLTLLLGDGNFVKLVPGQDPQPTGAVRAADAAIVGRTSAFGRDAGGTLWLSTIDPKGQGSIYRYDAASQGLTAVAATEDETAHGAAGLKLLVLDPAGNIFQQTHGDALAVRTPDGKVTQLMAKAPEGFALSQRRGAALGPNGEAYVARAFAVLKIQGGTASTVIGGDGTIGLGGSQLQFQPGFIARGADGALLASDLGGGALFRLPADGPVTLVQPKGAGTPENPYLTTLKGMYVTAQGTTFLLDFALRRLDADGTQTTLFKTPTNEFVMGLAPAADGGSYVLVRDFGFTSWYFVKVGGDGKATVVWGPAQLPEGQASPSGFAVCPDPAGGLFMAGGGALRHWKEGGEPTSLVRDAAMGNIVGVIQDAKGRFLISQLQGASRVLRYDPVTGTTTVIAGVDGKYFPATSGTDDSLQIINGPVAFDAAGDMLVADPFNRQIKRVPASGL
ncbi:MAG: serine/threonine protein kinase [Cyanobacteria bacterium RYN_339]|nr:serine/threonine protein kinase [Cyanobacteria bacterium RYN_339]